MQATADSLTIGSRHPQTNSYWLGFKAEYRAPFSWFVQLCFNEARNYPFAVHESRVLCPSASGASRPAAIFIYFCGLPFHNSTCAGARCQVKLIGGPFKEGKDCLPGLLLASNCGLTDDRFQTSSDKQLLAWIQSGISRAILLVCTALFQRGKKLSICSA